MADDSLARPEARILKVSRPLQLRAAPWLLTVCGVLGVAPACSEEEPQPVAGDPADCKLIANRCHRYDEGSGLAHDCHDTGHDAVSPLRCTQMKPSCLAACPESDGGPGGASGSGGASGTGGADGAAGTNAPDGGGAGGTHGGSAGIDAGGNECEVLGSFCHGLAGAFTVHCHELGHAENEPACEAEFNACVAACSDAGS